MLIQVHPIQQIVSPLSTGNLSPLAHGKKGYEVFGFAPYWTLNKLDNVDFNTLSTLAYFSIPVLSTGDLDTTDQGYVSFQSQEATNLFKKAHANGTRVVLTVTQMDNSTILALMDDPAAQENAISQITSLVKQRGIDGVNIDFEYSGNPGQEYTNDFSVFVNKLTERMHAKVPSSKVSVSVYASAVKDHKIYDIHALSRNSDDIFMMAYDFATVGADNAMPTAPLYGYKQGKYWYDVSTAVHDFLTQMPADKLILGVPYYGYNYSVNTPAVNAATRPYWYWRAQPYTQTYTAATSDADLSSNSVVTGWDNVGKVSYKAYYDSETGTWRMIFLEDARSLSYKYDFAKNEKLAGVGIWALGFDSDTSELWALLDRKFGPKLADNRVQARSIREITYASFGQ